MKITKKIINNINGLNYFYLQTGMINKKKSNVILFFMAFLNYLIVTDI